MLSKFSVKKPLTVFVAVIAVLVLGVVAYLKMTPDLLPNMYFPYVIVMTALFFLSYMIQQRWVFAPQKKNQEVDKV